MDSINGDLGAPISETRRRAYPKPSIVPLLVLLLLVNLGTTLYQLPLNRVIEKRLCREYYIIHDPSIIDPDGNISEKHCKKNAIQQSLAWTTGTMETLWIVGGELNTVDW